MLEEILFNKDFRCFKEGTKIEFPNQLTVIVGDNGSGKSSLVGLLRAHFSSPWTPSDIGVKKSEGHITIKPEVPEGEPINYVDLSKDNLHASSMFIDEMMDIQLSAMQKSSGQASLIQVAGMMDKTKAKVHIFDEPEKGLSIGKQMFIANLIKRFAEQRPEDKIIVITHSPDIMSIAPEGFVYSISLNKYVRKADHLLRMQLYGEEIVEKYNKTFDVKNGK